MSYERQDSTDRLAQYYARQNARIEAMNLAIEQGRTRIVSSVAPSEPYSHHETIEAKEEPSHKGVPIKLGPEGMVIRRLSNGNWIGIPKRATASYAEKIMRQPMHVSAAAPIALAGVTAPSKDGQLYVFDAKTGSMLPAEIKANGMVRNKVFIQRSRRS